MKHGLGAIRKSASLAVIAAAMALSSAAAYAGVTLSAMVPYTKVDP